MNTEPENLKKNLSEVLNIKGEVTPRKRQASQLKKKEQFIEFIEFYKYANDRTLIMKNEFKIDFINFEEPFIRAIESLLSIHFTSQQRSIIEWWLYDKWQINGDVLELRDETTDTDLPTDTPEDLWELVQSIK